MTLDGDVPEKLPVLKVVMLHNKRSGIVREAIGIYNRFVKEYNAIPDKLTKYKYLAAMNAMVSIEVFERENV